MKQLIVLAAVLPLLMVFLSQVVLDQKNSIAIGILQEMVYTAREEAKQEGCFTPKIQTTLRENIGQRLSIPEEDVIIEATETRQYRVNYYDGESRRGLIDYQVSVPIAPLMAGPKLFGISTSDNKSLFTVSGSTASERLP